MVEVGLTDTDGRSGRLPRLVRHRAFAAAVGFGVGVALTVLAVVVAPGGDTGLDVGETFEAEVTSYFDGSGSEPHVVCFDRGEGDCGQPLFADGPAPDLERGERVRATELWLRNDDGVSRLVYFVEPLD